MQINHKVALVTGAAHRLGKSIAVELHNRNIDIAIHCGQSLESARSICDQLNSTRAGSALVLQYDLKTSDAAEELIKKTIQHFGRLDYLVNNASIFYPTPFVETIPVEPTLIDTSLSVNTAPDKLVDFMQVNFILPVKLLQAAFPYLKEHNGSAVNLIDIYAQRGLANYCDYTASKNALLEATKDFAYRFAPEVRVNGVSPGAILWPENKTQLDQQKQMKIVENTALKRQGNARDISQTVAYLLIDALYTTGSIINVDGGRRLYI